MGLAIGQPNVLLNLLMLMNGCILQNRIVQSYEITAHFSFLSSFLAFLSLLSLCLDIITGLKLVLLREHCSVYQLYIISV